MEMRGLALFLLLYSSIALTVGGGGGGVKFSLLHFDSSVFLVSRERGGG